MNDELPIEGEGIEEQPTIGLEQCAICGATIYYTEGGVCWAHQDVAQMRHAVRVGSNDPRASDWPYSRWPHSERMTTPLDELGIMQAVVSPQVILRDLMLRQMQRAPWHWQVVLDGRYDGEQGTDGRY